jgi:hypothetical protein
LALSLTVLRPGGTTLLAVHWRHPVPGYPRTGDNVHEALVGARATASARQTQFTGG